VNYGCQNPRIRIYSVFATEYPSPGCLFSDGDAPLPPVPERTPRPESDTEKRFEPVTIISRRSLWLLQWRNRAGITGRGRTRARSNAIFFSLSIINKKLLLFYYDTHYWTNRFIFFSRRFKIIVNHRYFFITQ